MRALACCFLLVLACASAAAQESSQPWHWYYVSPPYSDPGEHPLVRFGTARVLRDEGKIRIDFAESGFPEMKPTFEGSVAKGGAVRGQLKSFFLEEPAVTLPGEYREWKGPKSCQLQQIMLRTGFSDGSILMLSRVLGECANTPPEDRSALLKLRGRSSNPSPEVPAVPWEVQFRFRIEQMRGGEHRGISSARS